ncbi:MAG: mercuric transport protein [Gammaproteobacteria bacterium]|nr:MAG: mercuric transport protein [Gammaproteobacteria bacterium]
MNKEGVSLFAGAVGAVLASACCLGPLLLVSLGVTGVWMSQLTALSPYKYWFLGAAVIAVGFAGRRIYRPVTQCAEGEVCAIPRVRRLYQILFILVCGLILVALLNPLILPLFY